MNAFAHLTVAHKLQIAFEYPDCTSVEELDALAQDVGLTRSKLHNYATRNGLTRVPRGNANSQGTGVLINETTGQIIPLGQV